MSVSWWTPRSMSHLSQVNLDSTVNILSTTKAMPSSVLVLASGFSCKSLSKLHNEAGSFKKAMAEQNQDWVWSNRLTLSFVWGEQIAMYHVDLGYWNFWRISSHVTYLILQDYVASVDQWWSYDFSAMLSHVGLIINYCFVTSYNVTN